MKNSAVCLHSRIFPEIRAFSFAVLFLTLSYVDCVFADQFSTAELEQYGIQTSGVPVTCSSLVGNPVNLINGNKYQREEDLTGLPGLLAVDFVRHYNSRSGGKGPFGTGWRHSYQYEISVGKNSINVLQADGRLVRFERKQNQVEGKQAYGSQPSKDGLLLADDNSYEWRQSSGKNYRFTRNGLLREIRWRGHRIQLQRDREGRLLGVKDSQDRHLGFIYDKRGRLVTLTDPAGKQIHYAYDAQNNLATITYPDKTTRKYHYEDKRDRHNLTGITDERGVRFATWQYDVQDRAVLSTHADGVGKTEIVYEGNRRRVTDALGQELVYTIEKISGHRVVTEVAGVGGEGCGANGVRYRYNDRLQLLARTGSDGLSKRYRYDDRGRLLQISEQAVSEGKASTVARLVAKYAYRGDDAWPSLITEPSIDPKGTHQWWLDHNRLGQITRIIEVGRTPDFAGDYREVARESRFNYENGRLVTADGPQPGDVDLISYHYDSHGRMTHADRAGDMQVRTESFDAYGRPEKVVRANGRRFVLEYDLRGRMSRVLEVIKGVNKQMAALEYDGTGHVTALEGPKGRVEAVYDEAGRPVAVIFPDGSRRKWEWDSKDRVVHSERLDPLGEIVAKLINQYDPMGHLVSRQDENGAETSYSYTPQGRLKKLIDPQGGTTVYRYDSWGRTIETTRALDSDREVVEKRFYDVHGVQSGQSDGRGNLSMQRYDDFGRLLWRSSPDGGVVMYRYDNNGRVRIKVDESGIINRFDYDEHGRLVGVGGFDRPPTTRFHYQENGKPDRLEGLHEETRYAYDKNGRLSAVTTHLKDIDKEEVVEYTYDELGRMVEKHLPGGERLRYHYQGNGSQISGISIKNWLGETSLIGPVQWDAYGRLSELRRNNGTESKYRYDNHGRLQGIEQSAGSVVYRYDSLDRLVERKKGDRAQRYKYDLMGHLLSAAGDDVDYAYTYDKAGNRISSSYDNQKTSYRYATDSNRLLQVDKEQYRYEDTGRIISKGKLRYEYDAGGRPVAVYRGKALVSTYTYNSEGERIGKVDHTKTPAIATYYLYENKKLIAELDGNGDVQVQYIYLGQRPVVMLKDGGAFFVQSDWRYSPVSVTDEQGREIWRASYSPFGQATIDSDPDHDNQKMTLNLRLPGQYYDVETDTAYNYYRYYDAKAGRYLTSDPMGVAAGLNTYAYVDNDPLNRVDLLGLYGEDIHYYMTYFLAAVAGLDQQTIEVMVNASQYIDNNPLTSPILGGTAALESYHFIMPREDSPSNPLTSFKDPQAAQLNDLYNSAMLFDISCPVNRQPANLVKAQLYGEYLHAYADTYAHRDRLNNPYGVFNGAGLYGHVADGTKPDNTYNFHVDLGSGNWAPTQSVWWEYQEVRTLEAEKQLFYKIRDDFRMEIETNRKKSAQIFTDLSAADYAAESDLLWHLIAGNGNADIGEAGSANYRMAAGSPGVVQEFNTLHNTESKIMLLNKWLKNKGTALPIPTSVSSIVTYKVANASRNRKTYLDGFKAGDLDGVLLPQPIRNDELPIMP